MVTPPGHESGGGGVVAEYDIKRSFSEPLTTEKHTQHMLNAVSNGRFYTIKFQRYDEEKPHRAKDDQQATIQ